MYMYQWYDWCEVAMTIAICLCILEMCGVSAGQTKLTSNHFGRLLFLHVAKSFICQSSKSIFPNVAL